MANKSYPEFSAPDGVYLPDDGLPFQRQATFKAKADGTVSLLAIDGYPLIQPETEEQPKNVLADRVQPSVAGY